ncbi:MAG: hypothetical protein RAK20_00675 [Conexivisphaerales archaeon]|nr:hypothetical protein [Conexivisphaerales archaeon]
MKDYAIIYDQRLKKLAASLSKISEAPAYQAGTSVVYDRYMVLWSYRTNYSQERSKLENLLRELNDSGYIEVLLLLPAPYQKGGDVSQFMQEVSGFDFVGRIIFFDLTPVSKIGLTPRPSVNLSAIPTLIKYMKENGLKAKVLTFNQELTTQAKIIESTAGKSDDSVMIIDNYVEDPEKFVPVLETYKEKGVKTYVFSTFFAVSPESIKNMSEVITTNAIYWDNVITLDISSAIAEFVDAVS